MSRRRHERGVVAGTTAAVLVTLAGGAVAYWTIAGKGAGTSTAGTLTITAQALTAADTNTTKLYPGGTADAVVKVTNPNAYQVKVSAISTAAAPTADNGCTPTGVTFVAPTDFSDPTYTLASGATVLLHLPGAMSMSMSSATTCQGATFTVPVTVTVRQ